MGFQCPPPLLAGQTRHFSFFVARFCVSRYAGQASGGCERRDRRAVACHTALLQVYHRGRRVR